MTTAAITGRSNTAHVGAALGEVARPLLPLLAGLALLLSIITAWSSLAGPAFDGVLLAGSGGALSLAGGLAWQALGRVAPAGHWRGRRASQAAGEIVASLGLYSLAAMAILLLSYLCASAALPMQDAAMARIDARLGLDWPAWRGVVMGSPMLRTVLELAYISLPLQIVVTCALMPFGADRGRSREFLWLFLITGIVTCALSGLLPAMGARQWFGAGPSGWAADMAALRAGGGRFDFAAMTGIITFPSFHTTAAVLLTWANRRTGWRGAGFALLNLLMIVATPVGGGHFFVDVIAGFAIALAAIAVVRFGRFRPIPATPRRGTARSS